MSSSYEDIRKIYEEGYRMGLEDHIFFPKRNLAQISKAIDEEFKYYIMSPSEKVVWNKGADKRHEEWKKSSAQYDCDA